MPIEGPWPNTPPTESHRAALSDAIPQSFWLDDLPAREPEARLERDVRAQLCIVGGGFTGLWAALRAKEDDPAREVVLLEAETIGFGASGRNGGFTVPSLTHGVANGLSRFADEMPLLERLGRENFDELQADLERYGINCDFELAGDLLTIVAPYQDAWLTEVADLHRRYGYTVDVFPDPTSMQREVSSPIYRGGVWVREAAVLHPAKLAVGLLTAALRAGVVVHEHTPATSLHLQGNDVVVMAASAQVRAQRVLLATNAFPPIVHSIRRRVIPVYDYALVTEPLTGNRRAALSWRRRQGLADGANQFHYYRLTSDDRILYGGYEAIYRFGGPVRPDLDQHPEVFAKLSQHFFTTFPQLEGVRFTHRWGGAIDTCSRFCVFFGLAHGGKVAYATGYTGLGVAATRFAARVALDLLEGRKTEATQTRFVRTKPVPFPPEPVRSAVVQLTRNRLAAADRNEGRRGLWLRTLDRFGLGFDS